MDRGTIIIFIFGITCFVFGGLITFSERFFKWVFPSNKNWDAYPEARKYWTDSGIRRYNKYGLGFGTFIIGAVVLAVYLIKYLQH
jgi:hypothetical protein